MSRGMVLELVSDVAVPPDQKRRDPSIWPHAGMEIGQSFWIATEDRVYGTVLNANARYAKRLGWRFTARKENGGVRVWRIA